MNKRETVQALMDSIQKGDFENAKTILATEGAGLMAILKQLDVKMPTV